MLSLTTAEFRNPICMPSTSSDPDRLDEPSWCAVLSAWFNYRSSSSNPIAALKTTTLNADGD